MPINNTNDSDLYVRRLERLESNIADRLGAIDKAAIAFPAVGVALIGVTQRDDRPADVVQLVHASLVLLAVGLVLYSVLQMRTVFIYGGQRKAIEQYAERYGLLPVGLFTWERGPALEISGGRRLDGELNVSRYVQPAFLGFLDIGMCGYALVKLQTFGMLTFWFIGSAIISVISLVAVVRAFALIPEVMNRVYDWTAHELESNRSQRDC